MTVPVAAHELFVRPDEQCVALTRDFRLTQRIRGHKYSVDDLLVAALARDWPGFRQRPPSRVLDLGCGLGSVLLMTAWVFPQAKLVGIEAQPEHVALAERNVTLNACEKRVAIHHGDLRDSNLIERLGRFELVTGTPPYFDPRAATVCSDPQRAYAQWELRGGIEDYARAAARALGPSGFFMACAAVSPRDRALEAVRAAGLHLHFLQQVVPKPGKAAFLWLLVASRRPATGVVQPSSPLLLRDCDGKRTARHLAAREGFGLRSSIW